MPEFEFTVGAIVRFVYHDKPRKGTVLSIARCENRRNPNFGESFARIEMIEGGSAPVQSFYLHEMENVVKEKETE